MKNTITRDFFLGFIKLHILYHSEKEKYSGRNLKMNWQGMVIISHLALFIPYFINWKKRDT